MQMWQNRFGPLFADDIRRQPISALRRDVGGWLTIHVQLFGGRGNSTGVFIL